MRLFLHVQTEDGGGGGAGSSLRPEAWAITEVSLAMTAVLVWAIVLPLAIALQVYSSSQ